MSPASRNVWSERKSAVLRCTPFEQTDAGKEGEGKHTITFTMVPEGGEAKVGQSQVGELKAGGQPAKVQAYRLEASVDGDLKKVWSKLEEQLKATGLDEKKIAQIRGALEKAAKSGDEGKHLMGLFVARAEGAKADRFMIGVTCSPASEALRAQLKLGPDGGLLVDHVSVDSPAKKAGIQPYDILLEAQQKPLRKPEDLVAAVQQAAKDKKPLSVTLLRARLKESGRGGGRRAARVYAQH